MHRQTWIVLNQHKNLHSTRSDVFIRLVAWIHRIIWFARKTANQKTKWFASFKMQNTVKLFYADLLFSIISVRLMIIRHKTNFQHWAVTVFSWNLRFDVIFAFSIDLCARWINNDASEIPIFLSLTVLMRSDDDVFGWLWLSLDLVWRSNNLANQL